jgi:hypothetical protein
MIHTIIAEERRKAPRQLAIQMNNDLRTQTGTDKDGMPVFSVAQRPAQLHSMGEKVSDWTNIVYAAEWDGSSPWITVHKGDIADLKMAYAGWPCVTSKEEWEAACAEQAVRDAESAALRQTAEDEARAQWLRDNPSNGSP